MRGYIYFIAMEPDEYVKIGFTKQHPKLRMAALQTGCPQRLRLRGYFPGTLNDERRLHEVFAPLRAQGEWFHNIHKLFDFVLYFDGVQENESAGRERFENALHDCVMQSHWFPGQRASFEEHNNSADWRPFKDLLWRVFGPWEDEE